MPADACDSDRDRARPRGDAAPPRVVCSVHAFRLVDAFCVCIGVLLAFCICIVPTDAVAPPCKSRGVPVLLKDVPTPRVPRESRAEALAARGPSETHADPSVNFNPSVDRSTGVADARGQGHPFGRGAFPLELLERDELLTLGRRRVFGDDVAVQAALAGARDFALGARESLPGGSVAGRAANVGRAADLVTSTKSKIPGFESAGCSPAATATACSTLVGDAMTRVFSFLNSSDAM